MKSILAVVLGAGLFTASPAVAAELPGADSADFVAAVDTWLDDNDADSLPALASLANEGNIAARLFLARIEATDWAPSEYVRDLSRAERNELFRAKRQGSKFHSSWLKIERDAGNAVAGALLESTAPGVNLDAIRTLYQMGEIEATYHLFVKVAAEGSARDREELNRIIDPRSELAPYLRAFLDQQSAATPAQTALQHMIGTVKGVDTSSIDLGNDSQAQDAMIYAEFGFRAGSRAIDFHQDNRFYEAVAEWVMTSAEGTPVANLCRRVCPEHGLSACANLAFGLVGGYYEIIRFDSPLESVIPQPRFVTSARATGLALRKLALARTEGDELPLKNPEVREQSICLTDAVAPER
jgi:hypothetical protein